MEIIIAVPLALKQLAERSAEARRRRDYRELAKLNAEAFDYCSEALSRSEVRRLLIEAGSIGYIPVA